MTKADLIELLTRDNDEYLKFSRVKNKRSRRPDLHAFLLLDELVPDNHDIVAAAEHDEIYLAIGLDILANKITPEQVLELHRCGVRYCSSGDCLAMFA